MLINIDKDAFLKKKNEGGHALSGFITACYIRKFEDPGKMNSFSNRLKYFLDNITMMSVFF